MILNDEHSSFKMALNKQTVDSLKSHFTAHFVSHETFLSNIFKHSAKYNRKINVSHETRQPKLITQNHFC